MIEYDMNDGRATQIVVDGRHCRRKAIKTHPVRDEEPLDRIVSTYAPPGKGYAQGADHDQRAGYASLWARLPL